MTEHSTASRTERRRAERRSLVKRRALRVSAALGLGVVALGSVAATGNGVTGQAAAGLNAPMIKLVSAVTTLPGQDTSAVTGESKASAEEQAAQKQAAEQELATQQQTVTEANERAADQIAAEQVAQQQAAEKKAAEEAAAKAAAEAEAARKAQEAATPVVDPAGAQAYAASALAAYGWGPGQMTCLQTLWNKESDWLTNATNPTSGAYGIPQSLPADKMATAGGDWRTSYQTQINWGLNYIRSSYGSPCGALQFHLGHNWY